jgi:hypothetical protein
MNVVLISTYELGRQPFGLASPAAWLQGRTTARVSCLDLSAQALDEELILAANLVAVFLPMHTATRIATGVIERVRHINPATHVCAYGLYAPMNDRFLRKLGVNTVLGGELEQASVHLVQDLTSENETHNCVVQGKANIFLAKQDFIVPDRSGLPSLDLEKYAYLTLSDGPDEHSATLRLAEAVSTSVDIAPSCRCTAVDFASYSATSSLRTSGARSR